MSEENVKTTFTLPKDLAWRFREEAPKRRMADKEAAAEALTLWVEVPDAAALIEILKDKGSPTNHVILNAIERWKKEHKEVPPPNESGKKATRPRAVNDRRSTA